jgi:hypothetical protein
MLFRAQLSGLERLARSLGVSAARRPAATYRARLIDAIVRWDQKQRLLDVAPIWKATNPMANAMKLRSAARTGLTAREWKIVAPWATKEEIERAEIEVRKKAA